MEGSPRQRRIAIANAVRDALPYPRDWFALSWTDEHEVIGRIKRGRRFAYATFALDDGTVERIVAWVHADSPSTS
jgi:hypothetical protein